MGCALSRNPPSSYSSDSSAGKIDRGTQCSTSKADEGIEDEQKVSVSKSSDDINFKEESHKQFEQKVSVSKSSDDINFIEESHKQFPSKTKSEEVSNSTEKYKRFNFWNWMNVCGCYTSWIIVVLVSAFVVYGIFQGRYLASLVVGLTGFFLNMFLQLLTDYSKGNFVYLIPLPDFVKLSAENVNEAQFENIFRYLKKVNVAFLRFYSYTFVSHRWEQWGKPDSADGRQTKLMRDNIKAPLMTFFDKFDYGMVKVLTEIFPTMRTMWTHYVWLDYMCVPQTQTEEAQEMRAAQIDLFRVIAENASSSVIIPKDCVKQHEEQLSGTSEDSSFLEYLTRGWCMLEFLCLPTFNRTVLANTKHRSSPKKVIKTIHEILGSKAYSANLSQKLWTFLQVSSDGDKPMLEYNLRNRLSLGQRIRSPLITLVSLLSQCGLTLTSAVLALGFVIALVAVMVCAIILAPILGIFPFIIRNMCCQSNNCLTKLGDKLKANDFGVFKATEELNFFKDIAGKIFLLYCLIPGLGILLFFLAVEGYIVSLYASVALLSCISFVVILLNFIIKVADVILKELFIRLADALISIFSGVVNCFGDLFQSSLQYSVTNVLQVNTENKDYV